MLSATSSPVKILYSAMEKNTKHLHCWKCPLIPSVSLIKKLLSYFKQKVFYMFHPHSPKDINHLLPLHYSIRCFTLNTFSVCNGTFPMQSDMELTIKELYTTPSDLLRNILITLQHLIPCWDIWHSSTRRYYTTWIQTLCFILPLNLCLPNCQRQTSDVRQTGM